MMRPRPALFENCPRPPEAGLDLRAEVNDQPEKQEQEPNEEEKLRDDCVGELKNHKNWINDQPKLKSEQRSHYGQNVVSVKNVS